MVRNCSLVIFSLFLPLLIEATVLNTQVHELARQKRWLVWNDEALNWVQLIFGLGLPLEVKNQAITIATVFKAYFLLPTNSSIYTHPSIDYGRSRRDTSRWSIYKFFEEYLTRSSYGDGRSCLLKTICEISHAPIEENSGILAEIISAVLRPSSTDEPLDHHSNVEYIAAEKLGKNTESCSLVFPDCKLNLVDMFSKIVI